MRFCVGIKDDNPFQTDLIPLLPRSFTDPEGKPEHYPEIHADQRVYGGIKTDQGEMLYPCTALGDLTNLHEEATREGKVPRWYIGSIPSLNIHFPELERIV